MRSSFIYIVTYLVIHLNILGQELSYRAYSILEGVPGKMVFDVIQDSTGLMYFSSHDKVFTYDGYKWETIFEDKSNVQVRFHKLFLDSKGKVWAVPVETFQNIILLDDNSSEKIPPILNFKKSEIGFTSIAVEYRDTTRIIYAGTKQGVFEFSNNNWEWISPFNDKDEFVKSISFYNGDLYYSTENSIYELNLADKKVVKLFDTPRGKILAHKFEKTPGDELRIWVLLEDEFGLIENGIYSSFYDNFDNLNAARHEMGFISIGEYEIIWGSPFGIFSYSKLTKAVKQLGVDNEIIDRGAQSGFIDKENNSWFVSGRGIYKTRATPFQNYNKNKGLHTSEVAAIEFFEDGSIFIGHEDGITIIDSNKNMRKVSFSSTPQNNRVLDAVRDSDNIIWFTAQFLGLGKMNNDRDVEWIFQSDTDYYGVLIDNNRNLWFTTDNGLYKLDEKLKPKIELNLDQKNFVRKIFESADGDMILCLNTGVIRYSEGKTTIIRSPSGSENSTYAYFDKFSDYKFVGTDKGLYVLESDTLKKFRKGDFYIDQPVYFISRDSLGWVWFGLSNGAVKWNGETSTFYSVESGLAGMETNRSAGKARPDGKFYIGTNGGLSIFDPDFEYGMPRFFPLQFLFAEDVNGARHKLNKKVSLEKKKETITIHYRGRSFINENNNMFEVSITNDDEKNTDVYYTKENFITVSGLKAGNYTLELRFKNGLGHWSKKVSNKNLKIIASYLSETITYAPIGIFVILLSFYAFKKYRGGKFDKPVNEFTPGRSEENLFPQKLLNDPEFIRIHEIMLKEKYYKDPNININLFAHSVRLKPRRLSEKINKELGLNFNGFLNLYRVQDAKEKLMSKEFDEYSIEGISKLVGFKSKASLYSAFKKYTGETPQSYKRNRNNAKYI